MPNGLFFFSRGVLEVCKTLKIKPDLMHVNDWQTALVPVYLKTLYKEEPLFSKTATLFTVHNIGYQGIFWHLDMHLTNLSWDLFTPEGIEFYGKINFLKGGLIYSDTLTTVSRTYSREIQTAEYGWGLEGVLKKRRADIHGILNGIDVEEWNPGSDKRIPKNYSVNNIRGKWECKKALLAGFGLTPKREIPVVGMISRMVDQKGFALLQQSIDSLMKMDIQLILLGSGQEKYEKNFAALGEKYSKKMRVQIGFDETLAHRIEAGSDMFLMPSSYEPCGLNQMYSLAYGTVPLVRRTGGLNDTVEAVNASGTKGTGFKFSGNTPESLLHAVQKAVNLFKNRGVWRATMKRGMEKDYSWNRSAEEYIRLYKKTIMKNQLSVVSSQSSVKAKAKEQ